MALPKIKTSIPGNTSRLLSRRLRGVECQNITYLSKEFPIFWKRAKGVNIWDVDGNCYLDWTSAFGVSSLGHGSKNIVRGMKRQIETLFHGMGDIHPTEAKVELCEQLSKNTFERWNLGSAKTILGGAGFEAIEAALKTALLATAKTGVITFSGAYHGLGYGTLSAGAEPFFRKPFETQLGTFSHCLPFVGLDQLNELQEDSSIKQQVEACKKKLDLIIKKHPVGAILIEPILGRGGIIPAAPSFLKMLRTWCDKNNALLIFDEIFTGWNRTGKLFACEHYKIYPDIICLGKALTSGFPLSACVGKSNLMDAWPLSHGEAIHTSTFLGNPLGCAMAVESIQKHLIIEKNKTVSKASNAISSIYSDSLNTFGNQAHLRGLGLMMGLVLKDKKGKPLPASPLITSCLQKGLILLSGGKERNVLTLCPPFEIEDKEIEYTFHSLERLLKKESS